MSTSVAEAGVPAKVSEGFGVTAMEVSAEMASKAVEASAKAEVESAYVMAMKNPRSEEDARAKIMQICRIPSFAMRAKYRKKVGRKQIGQRWEDEFAVGPSIRFAEQMLRCWRNVLCQQTTIYDDGMKRITKVRVVDLESNVNYSKEITLEKQVERRASTGREVLGKRLNSDNQTVFIVRATEDEIVNKEAAHASKVIRNNGLRLIPQHIVDEAMKMVDQTILSKMQEDPNANRQALLDAFARLGVMPTEIEKYLGVPAAQFSVGHLSQLQEVLTALEDGQATWAEFAEAGPTDTGTRIAEASQPSTQGERLVSEMAAGEATTGGGAPVTGEVSEAEKRERLKKKMAELLTLKGGDALVRGLKIPQSGVPAEQLDFVLSQIEKGIERLQPAPKK